VRFELEGIYIMQCIASRVITKYRFGVGSSVVLLFALYVLRLGPMPLYPIWNADQAVYLVTAKALSSGSGNRLICFPDEPPSIKYPIGYPLVISGVVKAFGIDARGLTAVRLVSTGAALCYFLLNIQLFRFYFSKWLSLFAALAIAVSPLTFEYAGELMTEEPFGAVWSLVLILTIKVAMSQPDDRRTVVLAAALGIAAGMALMLRTIGIAVIAGMVLGLMLNRRWILCVTAGLAAGITASPWIIWSTLNGGGTFRSYSSENTIAMITPIMNAISITTDVFPAILFPPLQTRTFESYVPIVIQVLLAWSLGVGATIVGLVGAYHLVRRREIIVVAAVPYLIIVLLWWWEPSRFLVPAYPILTIMLLCGLRVIGARCTQPVGWRWNQARQALCGIAILGGLAVDSTRLNAVWKYEHWDGPGEAARWRATQQALDWIRTNTTPNTLCVSTQPEAVYLYTNRLAVNLPFTVDAMEEVFARLPADSIVLATGRPNFTSARREEFAFSGIKNVVKRSPQLLDPVWQSADEPVEIYRIRRPLRPPPIPRHDCQRVLSQISMRLN
jgi:hypothetical protein